MGGAWDHVEPAHSCKLTANAGWDQSWGPDQTSTGAFLKRSLGFLTLHHDFHGEQRQRFQDRKRESGSSDAA